MFTLTAQKWPLAKLQINGKDAKKEKMHEANLRQDVSEPGLSRSDCSGEAVRKLYGTRNIKVS